MFHTDGKESHYHFVNDLELFQFVNIRVISCRSKIECFAILCSIPTTHIMEMNQKLWAREKKDKKKQQHKPRVSAMKDRLSHRRRSTKMKEYQNNTHKKTRMSFDFLIYSMVSNEYFALHRWLIAN